MDRVREMADGEGAHETETQKKKLAALELDGICAVGGKVAPGGTLSQEIPLDTTDTNVSNFQTNPAQVVPTGTALVYKNFEGGPEGVVDKVLVTKTKMTTLIKYSCVKLEAGTGRQI